MREEFSLKEAILSRGKLIADVLTSVRLMLAILILVYALIGSRDLLSLVISLVLIGWTTDILDGHFARADSEKRKTWIGDHEFFADEFLIYAPLIYFISADFLPFWPFFCYIIFAALVAFVWMNTAYLMAISAPVAAMPMIIGFIHAPLMGWIFLAWIVLALVFNWKRFTQVVSNFIWKVENPRDQ
jgi:phosphatidylglycerophosphate synthase